MAPGDQGSGGRVLFLSGLQIYPPLSGGTLRSFALVNALKRHGLDVFVYSLVGRKKDYLSLRRSGVQVWPEGIEEHVDRGALGFIAQYGSYQLALPPLWLTAYLRAAGSSPREVLLPRLLRRRLGWCNAVVADFPFVHPVFDAPSARGRVRILSTHNVEHRVYDDQSRWQNRWTRDAVRRIELAAAEACDVLVTCCAEDGQFFEAQARVRHSVVVPNGVDPSRFDGLDARRGPTRQRLGIGDDVRLFLFTASKWGPNREAFDYLLDFARSNREFLEDEGIHILVVGNVVAAPLRIPALTATGKVDEVEAYFAAADAALNPISSGAGTNVKMGEFIAARLPILTTPFGARGFRIEDGRTGFVFPRDGLAPVLSKVRRLFDQDPSGLRRVAAEAYAQNQSLIDMNTCARPLAGLLEDLQGGRRRPGVL